jgi:uncharacterized protein (TIGR02145 family)
MNRFTRYTGLILTIIIMAIASCREDNDENNNNIPQTGTVTDVDNNTYPTVKIGNKWWTTTDLQVKHYRNGTSIMLSDQDSAAWVNDSIGLYCNVVDDIQTKVGIFYNWNAVNSANGLAPEGWHVATDEDWKELERHLGMNTIESDLPGWRGSDQGDKLKIPAPAGWTVYGSVWGTNASGFSAEAKGCRMFNSSWGWPRIGATGFWWSATQYSESEAYYRHLDYKKSNVYRASGEKHYGFAVRCVKD